jgi:hypothetical protein
VKVVGTATGFDIGGACTSLDLSACYANACTSIGYTIKGTYINLDACAADQNGLYGYNLQNAIGVSMDACGGETNGRGAFHLSGAKHIVLEACRAVGNNTSASAAVASFADINDGSDYVTFIGCVDTTPNAATSNSVKSWNGVAPTRFTPINCDFTAKGIQSTLLAGMTQRSLTTEAGTITRSPLRIPHGVAPAAPVDGDVWTTTAGIFARVNGVTKSVNLT